MERRERSTKMKEALAALARSEVNFVIFEDLKSEDYVQFAKAPEIDYGSWPHPTHLPLTSNRSIPKADMEVTARGLHYDGPPPGVPPISPAQDAALKARGYDFHLEPNYMAIIDLHDVDAIVEECEQLFTILGSSSTFDLRVTSGK